MALSDEVTTRLGTSLLVQLTNKLDSASTVDTDVLDAAVADVEGEFISAGITFDLADKSHVSAGVTGVQWRLYDYGSPFSQQAREFRARFDRALEALKRVGPRDRMLPVSDSEITTSDEKPAGVTGDIRSSFDRENLEGFRLRQPHQGPSNLYPRGV